MPTDVPATGVPPTSLAALAPAAGLAGRVGRTVSAVDATLDFLDFALSPAIDFRVAAAGCAAAATGSTRRLALRGVVVVPGVRVSGRELRSGTLRLRVAAARRRAGACEVTRRGRLTGPARRAAGSRAAGEPPAGAGVAVRRCG